MGKRINSFLAVGPGQVVPVWTPVCDWAALPTVPPNSREGDRRMECLSLHSAGRVSPGISTSLGGHHCPQDQPGPSHPRGHHNLPQLAAELTLPRPCLCGSAPAPSIDQSVPAKSKRRLSQGGNNQAEAPQMHPAGRPTWYLSYTTGRVNIDTTAGEKRSTVLCSCRSHSPRGETYFGGKHFIVPLGQLIHQGALY